MLLLDLGLQIIVENVTPHALTLRRLVLPGSVQLNATFASTTNPADPLGLSEQASGPVPS